MYRVVFRSRWLALAFVAMTLLSVYTIVGSAEEEGVLTRAQSAIEEQRAAVEKFEEPNHSPATVEPLPEDTVFLSDEELIDDTQGIDPSGYDPNPPEDDR